MGRISGSRRDIIREQMLSLPTAVDVMESMCFRTSSSATGEKRKEEQRGIGWLLNFLRVQDFTLASKVTGGVEKWVFMIFKSNVSSKETDALPIPSDLRNVQTFEGADPRIEL